MWVTIAFSIKADIQDFSIPSSTPCSIKACFTPSTNGCRQLILNQIAQAKNSIYVQAYSFTDPSIVNALVKAHERGVTVQIILDKSQVSAKESKLHLCYAKGIPVYIDKIKGIAHNKVIIIDKIYVITGSYNFSQSAEKRNAENFLIIEDSALALQYTENWYKRWNNSYIYGKEQFREGKNVGIMVNQFQEWLSDIFMHLETCFT